jgi:predicted GIY-YIG superfamily endonuclease
MREDKIKEKEKFMSMMQAIKAEDELKEKLRLQSMKATQTTLEQQIKQKKE